MNRQQLRHGDIRVAIGYCHPGSVNGGFMESIVQLLMLDKRVASVISQRSGPRIAEARNLIVRKFLTDRSQESVEWLWCLDTDMSFPPDTLSKLLAVADPKERPIIGGLCFGGGDGRPLFPTLYRLKDDSGNCEALTDYPEGLVKVDATGAACLLIHWSVLAKMAEAFMFNGEVPNAYPWFFEGGVSKTGEPFGEDIGFCMRASALGFPLFVDTRIGIGHVKPQTLNETLFLSQREEVST